MRHLKTFESINLDDCYRFAGKPVKIISSESITSSEISISFVYEDGTIGHFNYTYDDFHEVFIPIDCSEFTSRYNTPKKREPVAIQPSIMPPKISKERFDLVYYSRNKSIEVVQKNIPSKLAYALKYKNKNKPEYKNGNLIVEPTKYA